MQIKNIYAAKPPSACCRVYIEENLDNSLWGQAALSFIPQASTLIALRLSHASLPVEFAEVYGRTISERAGEEDAAAWLLQITFIFRRRRRHSVRCGVFEIDSENCSKLWTHCLALLTTKRMRDGERGRLEGAVSNCQLAAGA